MKKLIFLVLFIPTICLGYGNHTPLRILNIKASGTGSPATTSAYRIYRAYPGIPYTIPVGAAGGKYPYVYSLSGEPSGMTINAKTGVVTWTNPQTSDANITVRVTDADNDYVESAWGVTVGTSGFLFVDDSTDASGTGTISDPYDSIQDILDLGSGAVDSIVYYRAGTYNVPIHNPYRSTPGAWGCNLQSRAHAWIGYPGETATLNMRGANASNAGWFETHTGTPSQVEVWLENLTIQSPVEWGMRHSVGGHYLTFFKLIFDNLVGSSIASNTGSLFSQHYGDIYYTYIVDSTFSDFEEAHGIGSIYDTTDILIERNLFNVKTGLGSAIAIKAHCDYATIRGNKFASVNSSYADANNGLFNDSDHIEIYNNFSDGGNEYFNVEPPPDENTRTLWLYKNTHKGRVYMRNLDYPDSCEGPWTIEANVFENSVSGWELHYSSAADGDQCVTSADNSGATSGLIDTDGKLLAQTYVGLRGWQLADGTTPLEAAGTPPVQNGRMQAGSFSGTFQ